ncbi:unnamed protein product [Trichobilharzia regenti]|nr:unnamed protein product [Trichobilharzia regenti]
MYPDGPDDSGKMFERPGRLTDLLPEPYENSQAARVANNGAEPPDLTYIVKARHGNEDYIFHLLTGYMDPPPGRTVPDGQYYNPYFPGGALNVASFLCWTSDRNHDERKRVLSKAALVTGMLAIIAGIYKRKRWSDIKTRKVIYKNRPIPKDV